MKHELFIKQESKSLGGRIRLNLAEAITGRDDQIPTKKQSLDYFQSLNNLPSYWKYFIHSLITIRHIKSVDFSDIKEFQNENEIIIDSNFFQKLYSKLILRVNALEITNIPMPLPKDLCVWIIRDEYENQNNEEIVFILAGEESPESVLLIANLINDSERGDINMVFYHSDENSPIRIVESKTKIYQNFLVGIMSYAVSNKISLVGNILNQEDNSNKAKSHDRFPTDDDLTDLLDEVILGKRKCYKYQVPLDMVIPFNYEYAIEFPDNHIFDSTYESEQLIELGIVTYERNGKLIMSDDYSTYLAARILGFSEIVVVNLGEIKIGDYQLLEVGGKELLPPIRYRPRLGNLSEEIMKNMLNEKILTIQKSRKIKELLFNNFSDIKRAIKENKLEQALDYLEDISLEQNDLNEIISLKGRVKKLKSDSILGIIKYEDEVLEFNRIRISILRLTEKI